MTNQFIIDQELSSQIDDFLEGDISRISPKNILYLISEFGLESFKDISILNIQEMFLKEDI